MHKPCLYHLLAIHREKKVVAEEKEAEEQRVGDYKKLSNCPISAARQCAVWDDAPHVEISAPHNKCTALKCATVKQRCAIWTHPSTS